MRTFTLRQRLRYRLDTWMSKGTAPVIIWLFALSLANVLGVAAVVTAFGWAPAPGGVRPGFWDVAWMSLMRSMDAGVMSGDTGSTPFLLSMLAVTTGGVFVLGTLIGLISSGISRRLEELRKGRSPVVEHGHVVVLGWSNHLVPLVRELVVGSAAHGGTCVVILAERDKAAMEDELKLRVETGRSRVVCRTGNPADPDDLELVHPEGARVVIALPDEAAASDVRLIKTLFAVRSLPGYRPGAPRIVTAVRDPAQADVVRQAMGGTGDVVVTDEMVARVLAQTSRQPGLARVYVEVLDFASGSDLYILDRPELASRSFAHALGAFENACPIGLVQRDGRTLLNPPSDTVFEAGDRLVVLTDEVEDLQYARTPPVSPNVSGSFARPSADATERTLVLHWNRRAQLLLREIDRHAPPGAAVTVLTQSASAAADIEAIRPRLQRITVTLRDGDPRQHGQLESAGLAFQHGVIVLADCDAGSADEADAGVLVTLMQVHALARAARARPHVTAEVLDARSRELAEAAEADDVVPADRMASMLLAQLAESAEVRDLLDELFDAEGCEIRMRPAGEFVPVGTPVTFGTLVEAVRRRERVAIGYRIASQAREQAANRGIVLNPGKSSVVTFTADDQVVLIGSL